MWYIMQCKNDEEIVAVIAHELGHWKLNHTMYSFIAVQVQYFCSSLMLLIILIAYPSIIFLMSLLNYECD